MVTNTVLSSTEDGVCTITLNRPECLNAINRPLLAQLKTILANGHADPKVKVFVMRGAGRAFCSGQDLKEFGKYAGNEIEIDLQSSPDQP